MRQILVTLLLCLIVGTMVCCSSSPSPTEEFEAIVVDISVSAGGFGNLTVYLVEFDNSKKLPFRSGEFVVGNRYHVACYYRAGFDGTWTIDKLELIR